ncbi:signal peptidase I [Planosporangium thailandense]|uniref:Signal peptidase I n=1 Tax=Planosporangium thailandense TaxID=765197 RepID=A0ABX0XYG3_9ACTN|nr:signal peptidase I [Planosporangium thailandense]NJC71083.1 signal peptidase I [Planosporangium thailandense]
MTKKLQIAARWGVRTLLFAFLGAVLAALAVVAVLPRAVHGAALTVLTGSMTPTIQPGSVVVIRPVDAGTLRIGDVVTYQRTAGKAEYVTHRIVAVNEQTTPVTFTTKGDANRGADIDPVPSTAIRGKVWFHVPYLGFVRNSVGNRSTVLSVAVAGLIGYALFQLVGAWRDRRAAANRPAADGARAQAQVGGGVV